MKKDKYYLRIRSYPKTPFVSVWLCRSDSPGHSGLLHGELLPPIAAEVVKATGLPVEREESPWEDVKPLNQSSAESIKQQELFQ